MYHRSAVLLWSSLGYSFELAFIPPIARSHVIIFRLQFSATFFNTTFPKSRPSNHYPPTQKRPSLPTELSFTSFRWRHKTRAMATQDCRISVAKTLRKYSSLGGYCAGRHLGVPILHSFRWLIYLNCMMMHGLQTLNLKTYKNLAAPCLDKSCTKCTFTICVDAQRFIWDAPWGEGLVTSWYLLIWPWNCVLR